jgi:RNA polymerase sigma factor (sigma-70 family)
MRLRRTRAFAFSRAQDTRSICPEDIMPEETFNTMQLQGWMVRIKAGDRSAKDELYRAVCGQLERLARNMLKRFPQVRRWEDTGDVLQNATLRLYRGLDKLEVQSTRQFFGLAAAQIRRELLDLWRHYYGREGHGANYASAELPPGSVAAPEGMRAADGALDDEDWGRFHEAVEQLPGEEREIVGLIFYHNWKQADVAELFQVDVRTVQRRWQAAMHALYQKLHGSGG